VRDKHMEFDIWLEDQIKKSDRSDRVVILEGDYDILWNKNLTQVITEFRKTYPNDYNYYFATYFVPMDQNLEFKIDEEDDDSFPDFKDDFFI
tara:strand:- start:89 stop:364 length:276 start_codon:yes stop_codon:yes gene_type:complete